MIELIDTYVSLAVEHGECNLSGDYKKGNNAYTKMIEVINKIRNGSDEGRKQFYNLMYHDNDSVKTWTAVTLLGTFKQEALKVLEVVKNKRNDILSFNAKMTIESWEKGLITNIENWEK